MNVNLKTEEVRWQVMLAMLEEFPTLRERIKTYLKKQDVS